MNKKLLFFIIFITTLSNNNIHTIMQIEHGILCAIEGIEGCGKSTFIKLLEQELTNCDLLTVATKEPGKTQLGQTLRSILMNRSVPTCTQAEFLLFAADRSQHFEEFIIPHLEKKYIILSDRMATSSLVYQGYVKGLDKGMIEQINTWAMKNIEPHVIFYLKIDPKIAAKRIALRNQVEKSVAFEKEILPKQQELSDSFDHALKNKKNVIILDASKTPEQLVDQAMKTILNIVEIE